MVFMGSVCLQCAHPLQQKLSERQEGIHVCSRTYPSNIKGIAMNDEPDNAR